MPSNTETAPGVDVSGMLAPLLLSPRSGPISARGIATDTRALAAGEIFVALSGKQQRGDDYAEEALARGAALVVSQSERPASIAAEKWLRVSDANCAAAVLASALYPKQPEHIVAVTGTDGKTSTAEFTRQFWAKQGMKAASLGTLGLIGDPAFAEYPALNTTPYPVQLHKILQGLANDRCTHLAMEASSHGLDQKRLDGVRLKAAAFTTLSRDHLDYHETEAAYFSAKKYLFETLLPEGAAAVLNADDKSFVELESICAARGQKIVSYGKKGRDLTLLEARATPTGQALSLEIFGERHALELPLIGAFQAMNMLAALGLSTVCGIQLKQAVTDIASLTPVPGRLQRVTSHPNGAAIYLDYAHTPAALENILKTLRPHVAGKLHLVFGCGGDRDPGKREPMGKAANDFADRVIVTDDNPRGENAAAIRAEVLRGCPNAKNIGDRKAAITAAIGALEPGDTLLVAGKGHERTQTVGSEILPFDDAEVVREILGMPAAGKVAAS